MALSKTLIQHQRIVKACLDYLYKTSLLKFLFQHMLYKNPKVNNIHNLLYFINLYMFNKICP